MQFRLFEQEDLERYLGWVNQEAIWRVDNPGPYIVRTPATFAPQWQKIVGWQRSWMMIVDGREIGYIGFISDEDDELTNEFFIVIGDVSEWGKGHGRTAMQWLFEEARRLRLDSLTGQVLGNNRRALAFYEQLGFVVTGEHEPRFERDGETYMTIRIEIDLSGA